jgi:hypothetical protein
MGMQEMKKFSLVGGTNLALRLGHRLSIDLDLFTNEPFEPEFVYRVLESKFEGTVMASQSDQMLFLFIGDLKIDIVQLPYPWLQPYEEEEGIRLASLPDIAAMKLSAVARRGVKKDFWDIAALLDHYSLEDMIEFYKEKYTSRDIFHLLRSLVYFTDAETQKDPEPIIKTTWAKVKNKVSVAVRQYVDRHS